MVQLDLRAFGAKEPFTYIASVPVTGSANKVEYSAAWHKDDSRWIRRGSPAGRGGTLFKTRKRMRAPINASISHPVHA
jgi:hypothetical protein